MATRAQIRFATREEGVTFSEHPDAIHAQFYAHWDGYPEHRGVQIAESILDGKKLDGWEIDHLDTRRGDLEFIYYIWQTPGKDTWISIFACKPFSNEDDECIFVGGPQKLIDEYKKKTNDEG